MSFLDTLFRPHIFVPAFALLFAVPTIPMLVTTWQYQQRAVRTTGSVISVARSKSYFRPTVRFSTREGEEIVFEGSSGVYKVGDQVAVIYDPAHPQSKVFYKPHVYGSVWTLWALPAVFSAVSLLLLALGFTLLAFRLRGRRAPALSGPTVPPDAASMAQVRTLAGRGQKIEAIKLYREATGAGLLEAKEAVERMSEDS